MDCTNHIRLVTAVPPISSYVIPYSSSGPKIYQISTFISIQDESHCGPTTCEIRPEGCVTGSGPSQISITSVSPIFEYEASQNTEDGYGAVKFCLHCDSTNQATPR